jgi:hypothetical protein
MSKALETIIQMYSELHVNPGMLLEVPDMDWHDLIPKDLSDLEQFNSVLGNSSNTKYNTLRLWTEFPEKYIPTGIPLYLWVLLSAHKHPAEKIGSIGKLISFPIEVLRNIRLENDNLRIHIKKYGKLSEDEIRIDRFHLRSRLKGLFVKFTKIPPVTQEDWETWSTRILKYSSLATDVLIGTFLGSISACKQDPNFMGRDI